jgi:hypothetical protein
MEGRILLGMWHTKHYSQAAEKNPDAKVSRLDES